VPARYLQFLTAVVEYAKRSLSTVHSGHVSTTYTLQSHGNTIGEYPQQVRAEFSLAPVMPLAMTLLMVTSGSFANVRVPTTGRLEVLLAGSGGCPGALGLGVLCTDCALSASCPPPLPPPRTHLCSAAPFEYLSLCPPLSHPAWECGLSLPVLYCLVLGCLVLCSPVPSRQGALQELCHQHVHSVDGGS
jgi:hypothetical protein